MSSQSPIQELTSLLQALSKPSLSGISPCQINLVATSLLPTATREIRGLAYLALTKLVERGKSKTKQVDHEALLSPLMQVFSTETDSTAYLPFVHLLASLFPLDPKTSIALITTKVGSISTGSAKDEPPTSSTDIDALDVLLEAAELQGPLQLALADLLAAAAGTKQGRDMVRSRAIGWLVGALDYGSDKALGAVCAVALSKMGREEQPGQELDSEVDVPNDEALCDRMMALVSTSSHTSLSLISTLEGLSVLSTRPRIKHRLAANQSFLRSLIALSPIPDAKGGSLPVPSSHRIASSHADSSSTPTDVPLAPIDTGICYGITTILSHLSAPKPILSAEEQQIAKLRAMAISGMASGSKGDKGGGKVSTETEQNEDEQYENDDAVRDRVAMLYQAGIVPALSGLVRADSLQVKITLGQLCLHLVQDKNHRLGFIRDGGFKVLGKVIRDITSPAPATATTSNLTSNPPQPNPVSIASAIPALQALAKLTITTPPPLLFPPPHQTTALNALRPLYLLLVHSTSLLCSFEALMALTNLASVDPTIADRIVSARVSADEGGETVQSMWQSPASQSDEVIKGLSVMSKIEDLLYEDNHLVRRAAVELMCNLSASEKGFEYMSGEAGETEEADEDGTAVVRTDYDQNQRQRQLARVRNRLHILLALLRPDDGPTRLAAGGCLAVVSESAVACEVLLDLPRGAAHGSGDAGEEGAGEGAEQGGGGESEKKTSEVEKKIRAKRTSVWRRMTELISPEEVEEEEEEEEEGDEGSKSRITPIVTREPDAGMIHRAIVIVVNLVSYARGKTVGDAPGNAGNADAGGTRWVKHQSGIRDAGLEVALIGLLERREELGLGREVVEMVVGAVRLIRG